MSHGSPRAIAWTALVRVDEQEAFANLALDAELSKAGRLDPRDAALATELTYGVLRRQGSLDRALAPLLRQGLESLEPRVRTALRLGAYQLLHTRIPPHAAVAESVSAAKATGLARAAGLINAVLRRLAREGAPPPIDPAKEPRSWLEVEGSLPPWLAGRLLDRLGPAEAVAFAEATLQPAPNALRANRTRIRRDDLARRLEAELPGARIRAGAFAPDALLVEGSGALNRLPSYEEGLFAPQDEAAQLVAHLAAPEPGSRVLDTCAAPGGKACYLAELGAAEVVAMDIHERKVRRIAEEARRLGLDAVRPLVGDAAEPLPGGFDLVLVDAPCTALGTLQRHPELRTRRSEADLARMVEGQGRFLARAAEAVRPGGVLVYAVCSFLPEEGAERIETFLREAGDRFAPAPVESPLFEGGWRLETWPHRQGMDAFFAARLRRMR